MLVTAFATPFSFSLRSLLGHTSGIESYPNKAEQWSYNFFVELEGHVEDSNVKKALEELGQLATFINVIGSFAEAY